MSRDEDAGDAKAPTASCEPDVPKAVLQAQLRAIRDVWTSESVRSNDRHADAGRLYARGLQGGPKLAQARKEAAKVIEANAGFPSRSERAPDHPRGTASGRQDAARNR